MDALAGLGGIGAIVAVFWAIAGFCIPFFIWGIHPKTHKISSDLSDCKKLLRTIAGEPAGQSKKDDSLLRDM